MTQRPDPQPEHHVASRTVESRVEKLEFVVAHLQYTVDDLNKVVLQQQKAIDGLTRQLQSAKSAMEQALNVDYLARTPLDDKPPHY